MGTLPTVAGVEVVLGDIREPESLRRATDGVAIVYHVAAEFKRDNLSRKEMMPGNVGGIRNILRRIDA